MNLYLDTSSLLKLFLAEEHTPAVTELVGQAQRIWTSLISLPEARSGLARALRGRRLSADLYPAAVSELARFWTAAAVIDLTVDLAAEAGDLSASYFLKGLDAIHLASAVSIHRTLGAPVTFSAFDDRLNEAERAEGLTVP